MHRFATSPPPRCDPSRSACLRAGLRRWRLCLAGASLVVSGVTAVPVAAQSRLDEPPRPERSASPAAMPTAAAGSATPGAERAAAPPPAAATAVQPGAPRSAPAEPADWPLARELAAATPLIEQRRVGNRVVEIIVTPAGSTRSYSILNREGQRPVAPQDLSGGLSTPRFLRLDF